MGLECKVHMLMEPGSCVQYVWWHQQVTGCKLALYETPGIVFTSLCSNGDNMFTVQDSHKLKNVVVCFSSFLACICWFNCWLNWPHIMIP